MDRRGWIARLVRSLGRADRDVDDEIRFHIRGRMDELIHQGWTETEARDEVLRSFGDAEAIREACRRIDRLRMKRERRGEMMGSVLQDVRWAFRSLRRAPGFAAVAVLTLGLGIGATTASFSVVDGVVFRPLPFEDPDRLVLVWERNLSQEILQDQPSPPNWSDWRARNRTFRDLVALQQVSRTLGDVEPPEVVNATRVSDNFFAVLGVEARLGRTFAPGEGGPNTAPVAVVSHGFWQRVLQGEPGAVGRSVTLGGRPYTVVGVLPPGFAVPTREVDVWVPAWFEDPSLHRQTRSLLVLGRLRPGVGEAEAEADLDRIQAEIALDFPEANAGWTTDVVPAHQEIVGEARGVLLVLLGAVGFVLLIACANVANLLLGRAAYREREVAVRTALGATGSRVRRQLLTESVVLGLLAGAVGTGLAYLGVRAFLALEPVELPRMGEIAVDHRVLLFAVGVSVLTGVLFGLAPARRAAGLDVSAALKGGRRDGRGGKEGTRRALVVAEVAVSLVLLVGAGLLLKSVASLRAVEKGFEPEGVYAARVSLSTGDYPTNGERARYFRELRSRLEASPVIASAGVTSTLPMDPTGIDFDLPYRAEGQPDLPESQLRQLDYRIASPGYFGTLGIEPVRGRTFSEEDREDGRRVLVVNESFARQHWPGEEAVGKRVWIHYVAEPALDWEVVGVVRDTRHRGLAAPPRQQMFVPVAQAEYLFGYMTVVASAAGPGGDAATAMRRIAGDLDPRYPLFGLTTVEALVSDSMARDAFTATLLTLFSVLALVLAAAGIYGVISYQVARRTREIGIRMALGAHRGRVLGSVLGEAALLALAGILVGGAAALAGARVLRGLLFEVSPFDPATYVLVAVLLMVVAAGAALIPGARAAGLDPVRALRSE